MYQILIVDDEPMVKIALKTLLNWEEFGFSICASASDGKEALSLVNKFQPDIIITDLKMPVMDGLELIKALKSQSYPGKILVLSNYGDYEYVRQALKSGAVDYMLKISLNKDDLLEQLKNCADLLSPIQSTRESSVYDPSFNELLLKTYFTDTDFTYEKLRNYQIQEDSAYYICYITQPFQKKFTNKRGELLSPSIIKNLLLENFNYLPSDSFIQMNINSFIILYPEKIAAETELTVWELGQHIYSCFSQFLSLSLYIIVTRTALHLEKLKDIGFKCAEASHSCFYDNFSPVYIDELSLQHFFNFMDYRSFASELLTSLSKSEHADSIKDFDLFMEKCKTERIHPEILKSYIYRMCSYMELTLSASSYINLTELQTSIETCTDLTELSLVLYEFFTQIHSFIRNDTRFYKKEVVECICYIQNHYHEKITLTELSASIGISENYLCKIFKDDTGTSIVQYIHSLRMEKAAALISENNLMLWEIAEAVGINDQFYFNRLFKKIYGMTPSQYKELKKCKTNDGLKTVPDFNKFTKG